MSSPVELPRAPRVTLRQDAILVTSDLVEMPVVILDVSGTGFRLEARETFYAGENILIGEMVRLRLPREGDIPAQIRWARGREAGGVFLAEARLSETG